MCVSSAGVLGDHQLSCPAAGWVRWTLQLARLPSAGRQTGRHGGGQLRRRAASSAAQPQLPPHLAFCLADHPMHAQPRSAAAAPCSSAYQISAPTAPLPPSPPPLHPPHPPRCPLAAEKYRGDTMQLFLQELCSHEPLAPTLHAKYAPPPPAGATPLPPAAAATLALRLRPAPAARCQGGGGGAGGLLDRLALGGGRGAAPEGAPPAWVEVSWEVRWGALGGGCGGRARSGRAHAGAGRLPGGAAPMRSTPEPVPLCPPAGRPDHHPAPSRGDVRLHPARPGAGGTPGPGACGRCAAQPLGSLPWARVLLPSHADQPGCPHTSAPPPAPSPNCLPQACPLDFCAAASVACEATGLSAALRFTPFSGGAVAGSVGRLLGEGAHSREGLACRLWLCREVPVPLAAAHPPNPRPPRTAPCPPTDPGRPAASGGPVGKLAGRCAGGVAGGRGCGTGLLSCLRVCWAGVNSRLRCVSMQSAGLGAALRTAAAGQRAAASKRACDRIRHPLTTGPAGVLFDAAQLPLTPAINLAEPGPRAATRLWAAILEELTLIDAAVRLQLHAWRVAGMGGWWVGRHARGADPWLMRR